MLNTLIIGSLLGIGSLAKTIDTAKRKEVEARKKISERFESILTKLKDSEKVCASCEQVKHESEFYKYGDRSFLICKECVIGKVKIRYNTEDGRNKVKEYEKKRAQDPKRKAQQREYAKKVRENNYEKYLSRLETNKLIKSGEIVRTPCEVCGVKKVETHHIDYSDPKSVVFLCRVHHQEAEGRKPYYDSIYDYPNLYKGNTENNVEDKKRK